MNLGSAMHDGAIKGLPAVLFACLMASAQAQAPAAPRVDAAASPAASGISFDKLPGRWVRPDGGYTITIKHVDAAGKMDASYANPNPLPFARAEASHEGNLLKVFLELRAGGYSGSTYTLTYEPAADVLNGVYFQAVAKQKFEVVFERSKSP